MNPHQVRVVALVLVAVLVLATAATLIDGPLTSPLMGVALTPAELRWRPDTGGPVAERIDVGSPASEAAQNRSRPTRHLLLRACAAGWPASAAARRRTRCSTRCCQVYRETHPKGDADAIVKAYAIAEQMHEGQIRKSGDPYITHPLAVATILAELGMTGADAVRGAAARHRRGHRRTRWTSCATTSATRSSSSSTA